MSCSKKGWMPSTVPGIQQALSKGLVSEHGLIQSNTVWLTDLFFGGELPLRLYLLIVLFILEIPTPFLSLRRRKERRDIGN